jgi:outer membrane protein assembly factor BamB
MLRALSFLVALCATVAASSRPALWTVCTAPSSDVVCPGGIQHGSVAFPTPTYLSDRNVSTGKEVFRYDAFPHREGYAHPVLSDDGKIVVVSFFTSDNPGMIAYRVGSHKSLWNRSFNPSTYGWGQLRPYKDYVCAMGTANIHCMNVTTGDVVWSAPDSSQGSTYQVDAAEGVAIVAERMDSQGKTALAALDISNRGALRWRSASFVSDPSFFIDNTVVFGLNKNGGLFAFGIDTRTGKQVWQRMDLPHQQNARYSRAYCAAGGIGVIGLHLRGGTAGNSSFQLLGLNTTTGKNEWFYRIPGQHTFHYMSLYVSQFRCDASTILFVLQNAGGKTQQLVALDIRTGTTRASYDDFPGNSGGVCQPQLSQMDDVVVISNQTCAVAFQAP